MDYKKQSVQNYYLYDTNIENLFISEYMPGAPDLAVKVYIMAMMHAQQQLPLDVDEMAKKLKVSTDDIDKAWRYWQSKGLVRRTVKDPERPAEYCIELLNIREMMFGRRTETAVTPKETAPFAFDDKAFSELLRNIEVVTGRLLEAREPEEVASWISDYGMDTEVILLGYKYCTAKRKSNRCGYVGAVLKDWRARGLDSAARVEESIEASDRNYERYRAVMKEMGFHRSATEPEKHIMDNWFDKMGLSLDDVMAAVRKTTGISNPNLNYVNTILTSKYNEEHEPEKEEKVTNENIFAKVNELYEKIREENAKKTEENRSRIFAEIPRLKSITEEIRACGFAASRARLRGGAEEIARQREKAAALSREKAELLRKGGYPENALDTVYDCPHCRDTGVLDDGSRCRCFSRKAEMLLKKN